ncbi:MAG: adenosylcobinamide-phosphate synthase CbiB [Desulfobacterales bacterium]|nr:adenosylcobinamide-phosphate synthase CbiB [Desulfobacterales bacterium]
MDFSNTWYVIPAAFILDLIFGDPKHLPHPVRWMGNAISVLEPSFRRLFSRPVVSGTLFALFLIFASWAAVAILVVLAAKIHPLAAGVVQLVLIFFCLSTRSLQQAAKNVLAALRAKDLSAARKNVAEIVGRDVAGLNEAGVARATVESVGENLVDGVIAPLFFAFIGGAPLAVAYKMVNTLDSMIGYRNKDYIEFGKAAARIDDVFNYIPARLSVFFIALAAQITRRKGMQTLAMAFEQGKNHISPNSGYPEAAFASVLEVRLGGPSAYGGAQVSKPFIGEQFGEVAVEDIKKASDLMMISAVLALVVFWIIAAVFSTAG